MNVGLVGILIHNSSLTDTSEGSLVLQVTANDVDLYPVSLLSPTRSHVPLADRLAMLQPALVLINTAEKYGPLPSSSSVRASPTSC